MFAASARGCCSSQASSSRTSPSDSAPSRSTTALPPSGSANASPAAARRSRPRSSTSALSLAWETSTPTRRCGGRESIRSGLRARSLRTRSIASMPASGRRSRRALRARARRSATTRRLTAGEGACSSSSRLTAAEASRASAAARRSNEPVSRAAAPGTARTANDFHREKPLRAPKGKAGPPARAPLSLGGQPLVEAAVAIEAPQLGVPADGLAVDQDLRHRPAARQVEELLAEGRVVVEVDLLELEPLAPEQRLRALAVATPAGRVHLDPRHLAFNGESPETVPVATRH